MRQTSTSAKVCVALSPAERAAQKRAALKIKDWRKGIGILRDTPMSREADALGEQYRQAQR